MNTPSNSLPPAAGEAAHTPTPIEFVAEIDRMIDAEKPRTHLWNYCVWHRKALLRSMVRHDMRVQKVLAHHELMPGRVAANTEVLQADLQACNAYDSDQRKIKELTEALEAILEDKNQITVNRARAVLALAKEGRP